MFLLALIALPVLEIFVFIEVGLAIGWAAAVLLLLATSVLGVVLLRVQGRAALARVSAAVSQSRAPGAAVLDSALGFLGASLLVVPGFLTDAFGVLLLLEPTRRLTRRWISHVYAARVMSFATAAAGRYAPRRPGSRPADVEGTAVEDQQDRLGPLGGR